jgi:hypothetical protein
MKMWLLAFGLWLGMASSVSAQPLLPAEGTGENIDFTAFSLPQTTQVSFSVVNISRDNADAQAVGAGPGDVLRYELRIQSDTEDVNGFIATVDINQVLQAAEIIDTGLGEINGSTLTYPPFTQLAPCQQVFTFFARIKEDCGGVKNLQASSTGQTANVPIACSLTRTGPGMNNWWILASLLIVLLLFNLIVKKPQRL